MELDYGYALVPVYFLDCCYVKLAEGSSDGSLDYLYCCFSLD